MRDLNECKTEIFRRSEQRIQRRRKQQTGIFMGMLLLCLVFVAQERNIFWEILPYANNEELSIENEIQDNCAESILTSFKKIEIQGASQMNLDVYREITDKDEIMAINGMILDLYVTEAPSVDVSDIEENTEQMKQDDSDSSLEYIIIFTTVTGTQEIYTWKGNTLLEHNESRMISLTDEQCSLLSDLFNVIQE